MNLCLRHCGSKTLTMIQGVLKKIFGSRNERLLKQYGRTVRAINALEPEIAKLSDDAAAREDRRVPQARPGAARAMRRPRAADGRRRCRERRRRSDRREDSALDRARREALDELLPEAFAVVREAGKRVLNMRHFDVQLIGGMALHNGKIAEMRTGEGKTLVATLPAYLNALAGNGVHIVTVNDYLAQRDADWMGKIYRFLGLTVGVNLSQMEHDLKQAGLRRRHHLRHQQRVRLRLPARQHGVPRLGDACSAASTTRSSTRSTRS